MTIASTIKEALGKDVVDSIEDELNVHDTDGIGIAVVAFQDAAILTAQKIALYGGAAAGAYIAGLILGDGVPYVINQGLAKLNEVAPQIPQLYIGAGYGARDAIAGIQDIGGMKGIGQTMGYYMTLPVGATFLGREVGVPLIKPLVNLIGGHT